VDKLSANPILTQKIAENINSHLMKQHDLVTTSHVYSNPHIVTSHSDTVTCVSSTVTASCQQVATASSDSVAARNKSTTSTADLSINEDSLMSALEVLLISSVVWYDSAFYILDRFRFDFLTKKIAILILLFIFCD